jgi:hypothetical protein
MRIGLERRLRGRRRWVSSKGPRGRARKAGDEFLSFLAWLDGWADVDVLRVGSWVESRREEME